MTIIFVKDCRSQAVLIPPVGGGGGDTVVMDAGGVVMDDINIDVSLVEASFIANLPTEISVVVDDVEHLIDLDDGSLAITIDDNDVTTEVSCS